jgi:DNA-binding Lrp family transcriptional regulator
MPDAPLDALDVSLLALMHEHPRAGALELSRLAGVARATVGARLDRMRARGIITGYAPQIDLVAAGYPVQALATLEIAQGRLDEVTELLSGLPGVLEAYATTGTGDMVVRLAAESNDDLQQLLLDINKSDAIRRSTSVIILSVVVAPRTMPLLLQQARRSPSRAPSFRERGRPR